MGAATTVPCPAPCPCPRPGAAPMPRCRCPPAARSCLSGACALHLRAPSTLLPPSLFLGSRLPWMAGSPAPSSQAHSRCIAIVLASAIATAGSTSCASSLSVHSSCPSEAIAVEHRHHQRHFWSPPATESDKPCEPPLAEPSMPPLSLPLSTSGAPFTATLHCYRSAIAGQQPPLPPVHAVRTPCPTPG